VTEAVLELVPGGRVLAIDASQEMVDLAGERLGDRARVWRQDVLDLVLDEPVDVVVSTATLHWVADHDRLWQRLAVALRSGGIPAARTVAFASIVTTQLAQTLDVGHGEGGRSRTVLGAVAGAAGLLAATVAIAPLRGFLGLALPTSLGLVLVAAASVAAVLLSRGQALPWPTGLRAATGSDYTWRHAGLPLKQAVT